MTAAGTFTTPERSGVRRLLIVAIVLVANGLLWAIPSDVVELVARDRQTLLGRYSREHFTWILVGALISALVLYLGLARTAAIRKRRGFKVAAAGLVIVPVTCGFDLLLRSRLPEYYIRDTLAYRRPAHQQLEIRFEDAPQAVRSYPRVPPGFGEIVGTLSTDARGYRNTADFDRADVLVLGDSFAEGSKVSDEHIWPKLLAERSGLRVVNLGMSGYAPQHYLAALKEVGLGLRPRRVVCLFYEENDFRTAKLIEKPPSRWNRTLKNSPLLYVLDQWMTGALAPVGSRAEIAGLDMFSWVPLAVPEGGDARYYAFDPNQLLDLYTSAQDFAAGRPWQTVREILEQVHATCREAGAELMLVHAPSKAHVVMPLVRERLPADKVRDFAALRAKMKLPEAEQFVSELYARMDARADAMAGWCRERSIAFLDLAAPLRERAAEGVQVYYTYDAHWTPKGHEVAAAAIHAALQSADAVRNDTSASLRAPDG